MCSTPKGSATRRQNNATKVLSRSEYQEQAEMMRRASVCYENAQKRKAERRKEMVSQLPVPREQADSFPVSDKPMQANSLFSGIKDFLMQPVALKSFW